jgi:hypothetical protein
MEHAEDRVDCIDKKLDFMKLKMRKASDEDLVGLLAERDRLHLARAQLILAAEMGNNG